MQNYPIANHITINFVHNTIFALMGFFYYFSIFYYKYIVLICHKCMTMLLLFSFLKQQNYEYVS